MSEFSTSITVRAAVHDLMRRFGLTTVFGNPGSTELAMFLSFPADFRYILGLQESVVVGMADGFAQASGNASLVNLHSAAGVGNAMGNIFAAFRNHTPIVITAGQQARSLLPFDPFLASTQATELPKPYVKWGIEPARASDVPLAFARAYYTAMLPPRGPVFLSIPADDWDQPSELVPEKIVATAMRPDPQIMDWIESQLDKSMKPAFVVGAGVDRDGAWSEVLRLAEAHNARVWAAPRSGRCSFPEDHPLFAGFLPPIREKIVAFLDGHDLIFAIGAPAFTYHVEGRGPHFPKGAQVCQLIDDPATAAWTPTGSVAVGSIRLGVLDLLARPITMQRQPPALREPAAVVQPSRPMTTAYAMQVLHKMRDPNSIIVEEAPSARPILQRYLPITRAEGFFTTDNGGLGYGLPAALGVALAKPHEKIIAIIGDGSAMYSIQALWTAARLQLPITFAILNNRRYAALQEFAPQFGYARGEQIKGSDLPGIDFVAIARGHGCSALRVDEPGDLESAIRDALRSPSPMLLELEVV